MNAIQVRGASAKARHCHTWRTRRILRCDRWGVAAVEFAIVANLFFMMIVACFEFARLNMIRNLSQDAAYYAARHVIVPGATSGEAIAEADRIMSAMLNQGYTVQVSELNQNTSEIAVTVSVDLTRIGFVSAHFLPNTTLETVARMKTERYDGFFEQSP